MNNLKLFSLLAFIILFNVWAAVTECSPLNNKEVKNEQIGTSEGGYEFGIMSLLQMRLFRAPKVIRLKMAQNPPKPIDDFQREEQLLQNILRINREKQNKIRDENLLQNFFVAQMEAGKMLQRELSLPENSKEIENINMKQYSNLNDVRVEIDILDKEILAEIIKMLGSEGISKQKCLDEKNKILKNEWIRANNYY
ncbi:Chorismate mutase domain-containing protein [Meloidogyne graminicola]|uniref:Chorismate mutase domain-containing protein n=1 Tax=Meloidogyne graminicola TaxID=189291 RepID=A0A8S9ZI34_9BILA|nr:Chorismate mutase domain-containing protein [Meloidogyne graminicola]